MCGTPQVLPSTKKSPKILIPTKRLWQNHWKNIQISEKKPWQHEDFPGGRCLSAEPTFVRQEGGCFVAVRGSFNKVNWIQNKLTVRRQQPTVVTDVGHDVEQKLGIHFWVVVSNIFYFHPYLGRWSNLTNIFQMGWNHQPDLFLHLF